MAPQNPLDTILLSTLSFYGPMTLEQILFDIPLEFAKEHNTISLEDLRTWLDDAHKKKLVKTVSTPNGTGYIRLFPKRKNGIRRLFDKTFFN